jgi:hypothetical protein
MEWYKKPYQDSIQMIKKVNIKLSINEYNNLAQKYHLLSAESLKYISGHSFDKLMRLTLTGRIKP